MRKVTRKLRPTRCFCLGEHESWFSDMAAKGLHLKRLGMYFAEFVPGELKEMKYRVDVCYEREMTKEITQMYKENGWDYVTRDRYFAVFSSPVQRNAPVQYESNESGMVSKSYLPSIYSKVYKVTFSSMAKELAIELQESYGVISSKENLVKIKDTTLDYVVVFQKGSTIEVIAVERKGVIFVSYSGISDVSTIIKEMEKKMKLISK